MAHSAAQRPQRQCLQHRCRVAICPRTAPSCKVEMAKAYLLPGLGRIAGTATSDAVRSIQNSGVVHKGKQPTILVPLEVYAVGREKEGRNEVAKAPCQF